MKRFTILLLFTGTLWLSGCTGVGVGYYSSAPPPIRIETRVVRPGADFVWVDGYWGPGRNAYAWTPGQWIRPPRGRTVWVTPQWELRGNRYRFRDGRWR